MQRFLVFLVTLCAIQCHAQFTLINGSCTGMNSACYCENSGGTCTIGPFNSTGAIGLEVCIAAASASGPCAITDSVFNNWGSYSTGYDGGSSGTIVQYVTGAPLTSATHTVTVACGGGRYPNVWLRAFSNPSYTSMTEDTENGTNYSPATGLTFQSGALTPSATGEPIVGCLSATPAGGDLVNLGINDGFSLLGEQPLSNIGVGPGADMVLIDSAASSINPTATVTQALTGSLTFMQIAFKPIGAIAHTQAIQIGPN